MTAAAGHGRRSRIVPALVAALAVVATVIACARSAAAVGLKDEEEMGARFALEARRQLPLVREAALTAYLRRVGERIVARLDGRQFE